MLKAYDVVINGVETTVMLTEADAKARGLTPHDFLKTERGPELTEIVAERQAAKAKARKPANKSRVTENKKA